MIDADTTISETLPSRVTTVSTPANLIAARIVRVLNPESVLDLSDDPELADQLRDAGVTVEQFAVSRDPETTAQLSSGKWDVITALGVLERLAPAAAEDLLEQICAGTDTVVLSCGPGQYFAPDAATVRPSSAWSAALAERGFYRRFDLDIEFAGPWTVTFERGRPDVREIIYRYEQALAAAHTALSERSSFRAPDAPVSDRSKAELEAELASVKHRLLISRDYAIGQEAELARAKLDTEDVRQHVEAIYESNTWKLGSLLGRPLNRVKRLLRPRG